VKLRYQMRGLGIGIIVTALMMGMVKGQKIPLSDAEIKVRALELGMVDSDSMKLSDISDMTEPSEGQQEPGQDGGDEGGGSAVPGEEGGPGSDGGLNPDGEASSGSDDGTAPDGETDSGSGDDMNPEGEAQDGVSEDGSASGSEEPGGQTAEGDMVTVVIEEGVTSYSVCELLEELGLVEDADSLDHYICSNNYSRSIQEGTYEIPMGTDYEEIVRIIMGNR